MECFSEFTYVVVIFPLFLLLSQTYTSVEYIHIHTYTHIHTGVFLSNFAYDTVTPIFGNKRSILIKSEDYSIQNTGVEWKKDRPLKNFVKLLL